MTRLRVYLVEPWLGGSHQAWAEGYAPSSRHEVHVLGLGDAHWRWRLRGGAVTLAEQVADLATAVGPARRGARLEHARPARLPRPRRRPLADAAVCLYLHETQPARANLTGEPLDGDIAYRNWSSMVVADHIFANSDFHRAQALRGAARACSRRRRTTATPT